MIESRRMNLLCIGAAILAVLLAAAMMLLAPSEPQSAPNKAALNISQDYADTLFDTSRVHCINLLVSDVNWRFMTQHAMEEQYVLCDAEIDGELIRNIAIRPKGNSSLASIAGQGSDHFSFKLEFDHYQAGNTYRGLDKLALNNLGQDISCLKDYLSYRMFTEMDVPAPLCAYTLLQLNGTDFGLYLAVEGIEDSFAARCYGDWNGNLYRPDVYAIESIKPSSFINAPKADIFQLDVNTLTPGDRVDAIGPIINLAFTSLTDQIRISAGGYAGDDAAAYHVVFDTAVFDCQPDDRQRYIGAVRSLAAGDSPADALDTERMSRYFAVHNFINNYDSYTGIFAHNYYLCEQNGKLSLVPWDYNLGFGAFSAESAYKCFARDSRFYVPMDLGTSMRTEKSFVNYPIDTPLISTTMEDRPLLRYLLEDADGMAAYHAACAELVDIYFHNGRYQQMVDEATALIRPYVERNLTFYTADGFVLAANEIARYGTLRAQSIEAQLNGTIPATLDGQKQDYANLIDTGNLDLSRTIDFGGLAFGITSEEVCAILEAVFGDYETGDVAQLAADLQADPARIVQLIGRVFSSSKLLSSAVLQAIAPPLTVIVCLILLLITLRRMRRKGGGKPCN